MYFMITLVILATLFFHFNEDRQIDFEFIQIMSFVLLAYNIPTIIVLVNYYKENRDTEFNIDTQLGKINISKNGKLKSYEISEVKFSIYHLGTYYKNRIDNAARWKMLNSKLGYWELEFNNGDRYFITNLLINFLHKKPIIKNTKFKFKMIQLIDKTDQNQKANLKFINEKKIIGKFIKKFELKSEKELNEILNNKTKYQKEVIIAVEKILQKKKKTLGNTV